MKNPSRTRFPRDPITLMYRVYRYLLPGVRAELGEWRRQAEAVPQPELRRQALASMAAKRFHCEGGAVYAVAELSCRELLLPLIVAFQTISDYLDNLCDRSSSLDGDDFRRLHQAMLDAVDPAAPVGDYYAIHPEKEDGGYLRHLVERCRECIRRLPSYPAVQPEVRELVQLYTDLQVYKHIQLDEREPALKAWWDRHRERYPELWWNEFAAATGSTLGVFMLFLAAARSKLPTGMAEAIREAYFPHLCGLHILLDYLIDQEEDRLGNDLNFCRYYAGPAQAAARIGAIAQQARERVRALPEPAFHAMIIEGLLALYLSDPKVSVQPAVRESRRRLMQNSPATRRFFWLNALWLRRASGPLGLIGRR